MIYQKVQASSRELFIIDARKLTACLFNGTFYTEYNGSQFVAISYILMRSCHIWVHHNKVYQIVIGKDGTECVDIFFAK